MSSSPRRHDSHTPTFDRGLVCQGEKIVGAVDLPADAQLFIDQFNHEYAAAGLRLVPAHQRIDPTADEG